MVESRHVRAALRRLRTDKGLSPEALADAADVDRATVYRIEDMTDSYSPRIETVSALVDAMEVPISSFFWRVEHEVAASATGSSPRQGGRSGDPASDERSELFELREQINEYKAAISQLRDATIRLTRIAVGDSEGLSDEQTARQILELMKGPEELRRILKAKARPVTETARSRSVAPKPGPILAARTKSEPVQRRPSESRKVRT